MKEKRAIDILNNSKISEVFYNNDSIWIQEVNHNTAKVGFLNGSPTKDVSIKELYEKE